MNDLKEDVFPRRIGQLKDKPDNDGNRPLQREAFANRQVDDSDEGLAARMKAVDEFIRDLGDWDMMMVNKKLRRVSTVRTAELS